MLPSSAKFWGGVMSNKSCLVLTAALLCSGLPAWSQELPDGKGKELAAANCNSCHTLLSRVGAGYTPEGWAHRDADDGQSGRCRAGGPGRPAHGVFDQELSGKGQARRRGDPGARQGFVQGVAGADAGVAAARSVGGAGRLALVHRPDGQCARPARSEDRRDQGISAQDAALRTARPAWRTRTATSGTPETPDR